jgi:hypothetical protein
MTPEQSAVHAQHVIYGTCLDQAVVLSGVAAHFPSFVCVTTAAQKSDADSLAVATLVDIVRIPHAPTPVGALGIVTLRGDGASDEWMYVLRGEGAAGNAFVMADSGFTAVLERDADRAKKALADLAAATTATNSDGTADQDKANDTSSAPYKAQRVICGNLAARIAQLTQGAPQHGPCAEMGPSAVMTCGFDINVDADATDLGQ